MARLERQYQLEFALTNLKGSRLIRISECENCRVDSGARHGLGDLQASRKTLPRRRVLAPVWTLSDKIATICRSYFV